MTRKEARRLCREAIDIDPRQADAAIKSAETPIWEDATAIARLQEIVREKG